MPQAMSKKDTCYDISYDNASKTCSMPTSAVMVRYM
jgi:hypothetical protein